MTFHSGKGGAATIGTSASQIPIESWKVNPKAEIVVFKNSMTGNIPRREATFQDATVELALDYDFDANPFAIPFGIQIGTALTSVKLFLSGGAAGSLYWSFSSLIIQTTPQSLNIDGKIQTTFTAAVNGPFLYPGA